MVSSAAYQWVTFTRRRPAWSKILRRFHVTVVLNTCKYMMASSSAKMATGAFDNLGASLEELESSSSSLQGLSLAGLDLSPLTEAKLNVALAYSAASLFYALQNAKGEDGSKHPIHTSELAGMRKYVQELKTLDAKAAAAAAATADDADDDDGGDGDDTE